MIQTLLLGALTLAASAAAQDADDHPVLLPGQPARVQLGPLTDGYPTWRIDVPPGATSMRLWTTGATDDLSLHLTSEYPTDPGFADLTGPDVWLDEELLVTVNDGFPLYAGEWYVTISEGTASRDPDSYISIRAQLHLEFPEPARAVLVPNEIVEVEVTMEQALRAVLSLPEDFDPPRRSTWQVELYGPDLDADLLVGPAAPNQTLDYPYDTSSRTIGYERVTFRGRQADNLVVHAFGLPEYDPLDRATLRLRLSEVTEDGPELPSLVPPLELPAFGDDARSRALAGTVAIFGSLGSGTGTVLSQNGLVLTNAHVVLASHAELAPDSTRSAAGPIYFAGFSSDPREVTRPQVALELIDYDEDLDLALLAIRETLDGRPLPDDLRLPVVERGATADLQLGQPLWALGFPMTGGAYNLVTITLSRGILSGFSTAGEGAELKTDAAIHAGISGGALLDEAWRLVGIPSSSITDVNFSGGIGFAIPIEALPEPWLELAERPDLDPLLHALAGFEDDDRDLHLGPHLPLEAAWMGRGGLDRLAWVLLAEDVERLLAGPPSPALMKRILDHDQAAFPALLNALLTLDPAEPTDAAKGRLLVDLLGRASHDEFLTWATESGPDGRPSEVAATANRLLVDDLAERWTHATNHPEHWIEMAHLDRPEHHAERRRFAALLSNR